LVKNEPAGLVFVKADPCHCVFHVFVG